MYIFFSQAQKSTSVFGSGSWFGSMVMGPCFINPTVADEKQCVVVVVVELFGLMIGCWVKLESNSAYL